MHFRILRRALNNIPDFYFSGNQQIILNKRDLNLYVISIINANFYRHLIIICVGGWQLVESLSSDYEYKTQENYEDTGCQQDEPLWLAFWDITRHYMMISWRMLHLFRGQFVDIIWNIFLLIIESVNRFDHPIPKLIVMQ